MINENHVISYSPPLHNSKNSENKLNKKQYDAVSLDNRHKKKKKPRSNRKVLLKTHVKNDINQYSSNPLQTCNDEVKYQQCEEKREFKKTKIKSEEIDNNFKKGEIYRKNKKYNSSFKEKKSDVIGGKSSVFKNQIEEQSKKQHSDALENDNFLFDNGRDIDIPKIKNSTELSKVDQNDRNIRQLKYEISKEKLLDTIYKKIVNRETNFTKSKQSQNIEKCVQYYKEQNMINNNQDKYTKDFKSRLSGRQAIYSTNNNTSNKTAYSENAVSFRKNEHEKSLVNACSEYRYQNISKHQMIKPHVMYSNISSFSVETFITNQKKLQGDKKKDVTEENTNWMSRNISDDDYKEFVNKYEKTDCKAIPNSNNTETCDIENFTAYFDKIWEDVIQKISGY